MRFARDQSLTSRLTRSLAIGAVPGIVLGAVLRVEALNEKEEFLVVVAAVLAPLGVALISGRLRPPSNGQRDPGRVVPWSRSARGVSAAATRRIPARASLRRTRLLAVCGGARSAHLDIRDVDRRRSWAASASSSPQAMPSLRCRLPTPDSPPTRICGRRSGRWTARHATPAGSRARRPRPGTTMRMVSAPRNGTPIRVLRRCRAGRESRPRQ
jgi:hypothetical protein